MVGGFNTNVRYSGRIFHVQTEDGGAQSPSIVTLLYEGGSILLSKKQTYDFEIEDREARVRQFMEEQHRGIVKQLKAGGLDHKVGLAEEPRENTETERASQDFGSGVVSKRRLDEVILAHLARE
ncbi:MAG: hypothetical protein GY725_09595 [bacterium]|nr:hypothetical protein [bacterium]